MSLNIECEERVMLTEDQYNEILSFQLRNNDANRFIIQKNYYIDTPEIFLINNHMVLRLRDIFMNRAELTLKIKGEAGDNEYNQAIPASFTNSIIANEYFPEGEIKELLLGKGINISSLKTVCCLETRRYEEQIDDYLLVIDKNSYNGIIDFNLEIEASSRERAKEVILKYCEKYNLTFDKHYISKSKRAINSIIK